MFINQIPWHSVELFCQYFHEIFCTWKSYAKLPSSGCWKFPYKFSVNYLMNYECSLEFHESIEHIWRVRWICETMILKYIIIRICSYVLHDFDYICSVDFNNNRVVSALFMKHPRAQEDWFGQNLSEPHSPWDLLWFINNARGVPVTIP